MRGGLDPDDFDDLDEAGRLDLAMVMVDRDYHEDGHLRLSDYFFGDELEAAGWTFDFRWPSAARALFVIYLDTHGNERRETLEVAAVPTAAKPRRQGRAAVRTST